MAKGSGTRSGLLWEIERILDECDELPQILLMENVPQVIGEKNRDAFSDWFCKLESLGYKSYYQIMNGKDYEIPQNRERCFMVSFLGDYFYDFPYKKPLKLKLKDLLEAEVNEKYYLSDKQVEMFVAHTERKQQEGCGFKFQPTDGNGVWKCVTTRAGSRCDDNFVSVQCEQVGELKGNGVYEMNGRVYSINGLSPTVRTFCGGGQEIKIVEDKTKMFQYPRGKNKGGILELDACPTTTTCSWENNCMLVEDDVRFFDYYNRKEISGEYCGTITSCSAHNGSGTFLVQKPKDYRIRKLTPKECFRLMGVKDEDFERVSRNQSNSSLYHCAGDSIVTTCLMAIFGEMLDVNWHSKIQLLYEGMKNESTL
jgi:DNA (cytosine-5)-methyltransferase 1